MPGSLNLLRRRWISRLLPATRIHLLPIQLVALFFQHDQCVELIGSDLFEADADAQLERGPHVDGAPQQKARLGGLHRIEFVQRAVITTAAIIRRVRAQPGIAQLFAAQRPVNEKPQGGPLGPLPAGQFGSLVSWNVASSASIAAFTATAWWMMGASPA